MNRTFILLLCMFCTLGFGFAEVYEVDLNEPSQAAHVKNTPIQIKLGDLLRVIVNENPTTGYRWAFQTPQERNVAKLVYSVVVDEYVEDKVHSNDGQHHLLGVGGVRIL